MSRALAERFTKEGYQVFVAMDGEAGLATALKEKPDLILLDIILPKLDGMTMMQKLRENNVWGKQVPIIMLTNLNADEEITEAISRDKPAYYLVKTDWTMDKIAEKVKERLDRAESEAATKAKNTF